MKTILATLALEYDEERVSLDEIEDMLKAHNEGNPNLEAHGFHVETTRVHDNDEAFFETPNLDCMDDADLGAMAEVFSLLAAYAEMGRSAITRRMQGDIVGGLRLEKRMEQMYRQIPALYRW